MSVVLSEPVGDVVAAVGKLRADDGLVTDTGQQLAEIEALLDKNADVRRERRYAERGIDLGQTMHGQRTIIGTLTPEVGEKLAKALAVAGAKAGKDDDRTYRQRQHDALGDLADAYLAHHHTPSFDGAPRTVIITMDLEMLEARLRDGWLPLPTGAQISAETARRPPRAPQP